MGSLKEVEKYCNVCGNSYEWKLKVNSRGQCWHDADAVSSKKSNWEQMKGDYLSATGHPLDLTGN